MKRVKRRGWSGIGLHVAELLEEGVDAHLFGFGHGLGVVQRGVEDVVHYLFGVDGFEGADVFVKEEVVEVQLVLEEHVVGDDGLADEDVVLALAEDDAVWADAHDAEVVVLDGFVPFEEFIGMFRREMHKEDGPDAGDEKVDEVHVADVRIPYDALPVPGEEVRREDEGEAHLVVDGGAIDTLRTVIEAVILHHRVLPFAALERRELDEETVLLLQRFALIVPLDRENPALEDHGLEFLNPVRHCPAGVLYIGMEFPVNLLKGHGVDNHGAVGLEWNPKERLPEDWLQNQGVGCYRLAESCAGADIIGIGEFP